MICEGLQLLAAALLDPSLLDLRVLCVAVGHCWCLFLETEISGIAFDECVCYCSEQPQI